MGDARKRVLDALRRVVEDNVIPYTRVAASFDREQRREQAESDWWSQFLPGHSGAFASSAVEMPTSLPFAYQPEPAADAAGGEIVWSWLPDVKPDHRGAYCAVLVLGPLSTDRVYAVRLAARGRDGTRRLTWIGLGPKDARGKLSWLDADHLYSVHQGGMRREGTVIAADRFARVEDALRERTR